MPPLLALAVWAAPFPEPVTVTLTLTLIIAAVACVIGILGSIWASWYFSKPPPPIPICKTLAFVRSERSGDDRVCTYVHEETEHRVLLSSMKAEHPGLAGCPEQVHFK